MPAWPVSREAPWFMLLPTNVCLRPWFKKILVLQSLMFICPHQRYSFEMVKVGHTPHMTMASLMDINS